MKRTQEPFTVELPRLLTERDMSIRGLARAVGVSDTHLSRILRGAAYKAVSPDLAARIATALCLDEGYFVEAREGAVIKEIKDNPALRDKLYASLRKR